MPDSRRALIGTVAVRPVSNRPVGTVTRGTTNPNRLRRVDRWLAGPQAGRLRGGAPVVVDLGYGAYPVTSLEMLQRLRPVNPQVRLLGIEIDPERVAAAQHLANDDVVFVRGGFELPRPTGWPAPTIVRAFNVLRQYDEAEVPAAWDLLCRGLGPDGLLVDGTCDEVGRRCTWVALDRSGPLSLTISLKLDAIKRPSDVAERLPKALIPPQRARRTRPRLAAGPGPGVGGARPIARPWGAAALAGHREHRQAGGMAGAPRANPLASR